MARGKGGWREGGRTALEEAARHWREWVPARLAGSVEEGGLAVVLAPRFKGRAGRALVRRMGRPETFRLRLDEFGTAAWGAIDGRRDVGQIADLMRERFGEGAEPAEARLVEFLRRLRNAGCVDVTTPENRVKALK